MRPRGRGYLNTCFSFRWSTKEIFRHARHSDCSTGGLSFRAADLRSPCLPNRWIYSVNDRQTVGKLFALSALSGDRATPSRISNSPLPLSFQRIYPIAARRERKSRWKLEESRRAREDLSTRSHRFALIASLQVGDDLIPLSEIIRFTDCADFVRKINGWIEVSFRAISSRCRGRVDLN